MVIDYCLICGDPYDAEVICEDCQSKHNIDIQEFEGVEYLESFEQRLREGFALLNADEKPGGYNFYWS